MNRELFLAKFRKGCKKNSEETEFGLELEHFVVRKADGKTAVYSGKAGVEELLSRLSDFYEEKEYSEGHLIGLWCPDYSLSLEPAAQLEISVRKCRNSAEIREIYSEFRQKADPLLEELGLMLVTKGYQPLSCIDDLELIPKIRYEFMLRYFDSIGPWGARMMKGTASTQVSIDYFSEKDFTRKYMVFYTFVPIIGLLFENTPVFEGKPYKEHLLRQKIWDNTDSARVDISHYRINGAIDFQSYLQFIMNAPIIVKHTGDSDNYSTEKIGEMLSETVLDDAGVDHVLSMVFPVIRLKNYIEIRTADSMDIDKACIYVDLIEAMTRGIDELYELAGAIWEKCPSFVQSASEAIELDGMDAELCGISIRQVTEQVISIAEKYMEKPGELLEIFND